MHSHYFHETAEEIIAQVNDKIDVFCASQTRNESVQGIASHLKKTQPNLKSYLVASSDGQAQQMEDGSKLDGVIMIDPIESK